VTVLEGVPQGLGVYVGRGGVSTARAQELRRAGVRHVCLCAEAESGWLASASQLAAWGSSCGAAGLVPHVYAFPGLPRARQPRAVAETLLGAARRSGAVCPVADLEGHYRGRPQLLRAVLDELVRLATPAERLALAITTFGLPSDRGRWPWPELAAWRRSARTGWIGWQCYERAADAPRVRAGIAELAQVWGRARVIPHVGAYERRTETEEGQDGARRIVADLDRACRDEQGRCDVAGAWVWSAASLDDRELEALRIWTRVVGWR
jgi:hypothetical protein